jgi:hypothetical protein
VCRYAFTSELGLPEGGFSHWHVVFTVLVPSAMELNGHRRAAERSLARGLSLFGTPWFKHSGRKPMAIAQQVSMAKERRLLGIVSLVGDHALFRSKADGTSMISAGSH